MSELKERALLERIGELTVAYEDKIADLRVKLTELTHVLEASTREHEAKEASMAEFLAAAQAQGIPASQEVVEGTVVQ